MYIVLTSKLASDLANRELQLILPIESEDFINFSKTT